MWKVYKIDDGRIVKAGFESDEQAKEWLERRIDLSDDEYDTEEMDEEEITEFAELEDEDEIVFSRHTKVPVEDDDDYAGAGASDIDYGDEGAGEDGDLEDDESDNDDDAEDEDNDDDDDQDENY